MSLADARAVLVAALDTVDGLTAYGHRPATLVPGTAWVRWDGYGNARDTSAPAWWLSRWSAFVVLDGAAVTTDEVLTTWVDTHVDDLTAALIPAGYVEAIEPARFDVEAGAPVPGIRITITRE